MLKIKIILSTFLVTVLFIACKKPIASNVRTIVKGYVVDVVKNKKLTNATVIINSCHEANFRTFCNDSLTSTKTNLNGEFEVSFQGDGKSIGFEASVKTDENYDYSTDLTLTAGKVNNIELHAREKSFLRANIHITNNPINPLAILSIGTKHVIYNRSIDTLLYFRVLPMSPNLIIYSAWDTSVGRYRQLIDTLQITMQDTTLYRKILPNVQSFPIR